MDQSTLRPSLPSGSRLRDEVALPGVLVLFSAGAARATPMRLDGGALDLGRGDGGAGKLDDGRVSRRHARVSVDGAGRFSVTDLGSQNGTFVDGERLPANGTRPIERVLRLGDSLLIMLRDVRPFESRGLRIVDGFVRGPELQALLDEVARAAQGGHTLHIKGESGTGKEGVAQAFHRLSGRGAGRLVPVNCATIPQNLAERLLFGAKRGAYSGADKDVPGYLHEADGGTLFLDEVAELEPAVQAKLLRTIESREVMPLGASRKSQIDFLLCSATNKDLRALVAAGQLREDLYFRIGTPAVTLPALRNRPAEIPLLLTEELRRVAPALPPHVSLVEECLMRPWPGNVRELLAELRAAARSASADGSPRVLARHLSPSAGTAFSTAASLAAAPMVVLPAAPPSDGGDEAGPAARKRAPLVVDDDLRRRVAEAMRAHDGNVSAAARALGLHRTQLRRLLQRDDQEEDSDDDDSARDTH